MFRIVKIIIFLFLLNLSWPFIQKHLIPENIEFSFDKAFSELNQLREDPEILSTIDSLYTDLQRALQQLQLYTENIPNSENEKLEETEQVNIDLKAPTIQSFSIHNVELGQAKNDIEAQLGTAKRSTTNEYGTQWFTYHENYQNFFMVMYDQDNSVVGLYTNQDIISSKDDIGIGTPKSDVRAKLGEPNSGIRKGLTIYQFQKENDYDLFEIDGVYVTIFYDKHQNNTVTAMQLINKNLEQARKSIYTEGSTVLKEGFEYQLFDLTNAARVKHKLPILTWDEHVRKTARKHSADMALNQYFDHTNLEGESPFDRMKEDQIRFHLAGENLAYGQFSSIFAHEGLMNSLGHRENILRKDYEFLGVGVAFNEDSQPYFTENFYAN
jgi:uncharacterized protein YkwD